MWTVKLDIEVILLAVVVVCWGIQLFYYLWFMLKLANYKFEQGNNDYPELSVIICAKNESINLQKHLPAVIGQDYPKFEVVVVNDASSDDSDFVLAKFKQEHENFYYTTIPDNKRFYQGKKLALTLGVKAAKYEHLVLTDADCYPESDQWLKEIAVRFNNNKEIVIGHGRYEKKKSLFNLFLRYETFFNATQYMGFALRNKPFMAVGRNLAYTKSLFLKSDVFKRYLNTASGDDDLFIKEKATPKNTTIVVSRESQTTSVAPKNYSEWLSRKGRHLTTSKYYSPKIKWWLGLETLTRQLFWILGIYLLFFPIFAVVSCGLILSRMVIQNIVLAKASKALGEGKLYLSSVLFDAFIPLILGSLWLQNMFSAKKKKWK